MNSTVQTTLPLAVTKLGLEVTVAVPTHRLTDGGFAEIKEINGFHYLDCMITKSDSSELTCRIGPLSLSEAATIRTALRVKIADVLFDARQKLAELELLSEEF